jgi:hypothetical protein
MANHASKAPAIKVLDGFVEVPQDQYIQLDEISGTTPLDTLQAEMLDPLARELARLIRERINCNELAVGEDGVVCGKIEANV